MEFNLTDHYADGTSVIIGFDSEYVAAALDVGLSAREAKQQAWNAGKKKQFIKQLLGSKGEELPKIKEPKPIVRKKNDVVSYQAHVISAGGTYDWFKLMEPGQRMTLGGLIKEVLSKGMEDRTLKVWPKRVHLAVHWSLADLTSFSNFDALKTVFDGLRKTYASVQEPHCFYFWDRNNNKREIELSLFDTTLLAPDERKLEVLGEMLGDKKVEIPDGAIENMRKFSEEDPELFREYGLADARIAAKWLVFTTSIANELLGTDVPPLTLGSIATNLVLKLWETNDIDRLEVLGLERFKDETGKWQERFQANREAYENDARSAFHGGRNETYFFGATAEDDWCDWDLVGAYVTALSTLGIPDWERIRKPRSLHEFGPDTYGAASVKFSFPADTRFPCLPVRGENSLIFPLQGVSMATAPEIELALRLGARMRILNDIAYIMPMKEARPFELLSQLVTDRRAELEAQLGQDSAPEKMIKTIGNSAYGKLAQGLRRRRVFDTRAALMTEIPASKITNPYMASHVTGLIRAVLAEILNAIPREYQVVSATTDGFITNAPIPEVLAAAQGRLSTYLMEARHRFDPKSKAIIKLKHLVRQVLAWRTRGQATMKRGEVEDVDGILLAKAGISVPRGYEDPNSFIIEKFIERDPAAPKDEVVRGRGLREIYEARGRVDFNMKLLFIANRMDFDWKRVCSHAPGSVGTRPIRGTDHVFFSTIALPSAESYALLRHEWTNFSKGRETFLKTEEDLHGFERYLGVMRKPGLAKPRKGTTGVTVLLRMFLRGYVRSRLGLDRALSNDKLAKAISELGFKVKVSDVENAVRFQVIEGCLRPTPEVNHAISLLKSRFPTFDPEELMVLGSDPLEYNKDLHAELAGADPRQLTLWSDLADSA
ncbi:hypothetical protein OJ996_05790 [Luteolibacter sp. GHJ8]|uniref:DNA-directed DNA polymerase n=1 Tax=Luteolibacter rhizosphaerae TaxID=2989719 RepID=A0ABT3FZR1_9BACT|nr:hypothetical protein [Luteolibacter rhizosphaerae]MCW1913073.1 hypothetical protein [Luteolibacter rhizosphaerae]